MIKVKKDTKKLIIAGIGLAVLILATVIVFLVQDYYDREQAKLDEEKQAEEDAKTAALTLTDVAADDIESVKVTNTKDSFEITKAESGSDYTIKELDDIPLDTGSLKTGINYFAKIVASQLVDENASDLAKYGLDEPLATGEIILKNGTSLYILVGNPAPSDNLTYVRKKDSNDVYTVSTYYVSRLLNTKYEFISTTLTEEKDDNALPSVTKLTITRNGEEPIIIREGAIAESGHPVKGVHTHEFAEPVGVGIDVVKGDALVYGLYGLSAVEAVDYGLTDSDYAETGLDSPALIVEMEGDNQYTLTIGAPVMEETENDDGTVTSVLKGYYGVFSECPDVLFIFSENSLPWFDIDYENIMTRLFLLPSIYDISDVIIESGDRNIHLISEGDSSGATFTVNGEVYENQDNFKYFYQYIISASAESIYSGSEIGELAARFTYKYRLAEIPEDVVEFYKAPDRKLVIKVNGEPLYMIKENYITRLNQNIEALLNNGEIIISW